MATRMNRHSILRIAVALLPVVTVLAYFLVRDSGSVSATFLGPSTNQNRLRFVISNTFSHSCSYIAMAQEQRNGVWVRRVIAKPDAQGTVPRQSTEVFELPVFSTNHWRATISCAESFDNSSVDKVKLKLFSFAYRRGWTNLSHHFVVRTTLKPALKMEFDGVQPSR